MRLLLPLLLLLSGCGTIKTKVVRREWGHTYSGLKCATEGSTLSATRALFSFPDMILSGVADTLVAPFDMLASTRAAHQSCGRPPLPACEFKADPELASIVASSTGTLKPLLMVIGSAALKVDEEPPKKGFLGECEDLIIRAAPGEREFMVQLIYFTMSTGFRYQLENKNGIFHSYITLKAPVEKGKLYRVKGSAQDKSCYAWLEDAATGAKVSAVASADCVQYSEIIRVSDIDMLRNLSRDIQ